RGQGGLAPRGGRRRRDRDVHVFQTDLEAQDVAHGVAGARPREGVDGIRVDALDADREGRAVGGEVQGRVVERVGRVEVEAGGGGAGGRVPFAPDVLQAGEGRVEADRVNAVGGLRGGEGVSQRLDVGEAVVGDRVRAGGTDRAGDDGEGPGHAHVA